MNKIQLQALSECSFNQQLSVLLSAIAGQRSFNARQISAMVEVKCMLGETLLSIALQQFDHISFVSVTAVQRKVWVLTVQSQSHRELSTISAKSFCV